MKRIVLLQNQTEMTYYGHADCRRELDRLSRPYTLLTADTISNLSRILDNDGAECVLMGSNVLHDAVMREYLLSLEATNILSRFLQAGKGLIVMMQYKAAYDGYPLAFIPLDLGMVSAVPRPQDETAVDARLCPTSSLLAPPLLHYPENVDLVEIEEKSRAHQSLGGVYWHHWRLDQPAFWDIHVECRLTGMPRPLLATSREHTGSRVTLCALPLDWHGHFALFSNVLTYAVDGRHDTAFLVGADKSDLIAQYLSEKLDGLGAAHRTYDDGYSNRATATKNIFAGIHNTLFLANDVTIQEYFESGDLQRVEVLVAQGNLRAITVDSSDEGSSVKVLGQRSVARDAYDLLTPAIGQALIRGYLDGSFRGTVAGLQELEDLPHGLDSELFSLTRVIEESDRHDRTGSYDEVIGATAALLWLRGKALGIDDPRTRTTIAWVRERFAVTDFRERLHSLGVLDALGLLTQAERDVANATLSEIDLSLATEIELLSYLEAAVRFDRLDVIGHSIEDLSRRQGSGGGPVWVDIPTTASLIKLLVVAFGKLKQCQKVTETLKSQIHRLAIPSMIAVEDAYHRSLQRRGDEGAIIIPWDGKLSTALKCLSAWHQFDQFLGAPVEEAAEAVLRSAGRGGIASLAGGAIQSLRSVVSAYDEASERLKAQSEMITGAAADRELVASLRKRTVTLARRAMLAWALLILLIYVIADHVYRTTQLGEELRFGQSLVDHFVTHLSVVVLGLIAAGASIAAIPWGKLRTFAERKLGARHSPNDHSRPE